MGVADALKSGCVERVRGMIAEEFGVAVGEGVAAGAMEAAEECARQNRRRPSEGYCRTIVKAALIAAGAIPSGPGRYAAVDLPPVVMHVFPVGYPVTPEEDERLKGAEPEEPGGPQLATPAMPRSEVVPRPIDRVAGRVMGGPGRAG